MLTSRGHCLFRLLVISLLFSCVPATGATGSLIGSGDSGSLPRDLTAEGSTDWVYWYNSPPEHKSGGSQFGSLTAINPNGGYQPGRCGDPRTLTWSDGTSTAISATGSAARECALASISTGDSGVRVGRGFHAEAASFVVPAWRSVSGTEF